MMYEREFSFYVLYCLRYDVFCLFVLLDTFDFEVEVRKRINSVIQNVDEKTNSFYVLYRRMSKKKFERMANAH